MKTTQYFDFRRQQPDRIGILNEWIERVIEFPEAQKIQDDGRIKLWKLIPEANRYLRVVLLQDGETVHNAFFDRDFIINT